MTIEELEKALTLKSQMDEYLSVLQRFETCNGAELKLTGIKVSGKEVFITKVPTEIKNLIKNYYQNKYDDCKKQIEEL